jgi:hypothetical protein
MVLLTGQANAIQIDGVRFVDIARDSNSGINFQRGPSPTEQVFAEFKRSKQFFTFAELQTAPLKARGAPGVALFDFDDDGDLDIYVTNGPGRNNSLYENQLSQDGQVSFVDVASQKGVRARAQDSTGVCFGDIDNDGDSDLLVLGNAESNRLYENQDGAFVDISGAAGIGGGNLTSVSCALGDVNQDGLLDIAIANIFDLSSQQAIHAVPVALNQHNQLFINMGQNRFVESAQSLGLLDVHLPAGAPAQAATISWAIAMIDIDQDGDVDIIQADDQGAIPPEILGGLDRGFLQVFDNDGTGEFFNVTSANSLSRAGSWMGLSFGDFDFNGKLDLFSTNFGNQFFAGLTGNTSPPTYNQDSRWFTQRSDNTFQDYGLTHILNSPFGWGTSTFDYDNDGDTDIIFHGGHETGVGVVLSPAVIFTNDGTGEFSRDQIALSNSTDHIRRTVHGMAVGDLNNDGFPDIVSVSNFDIPSSVPLFPIPELGGEFDADAFFVATFSPTDAQGTAFVWNEFEFSDGTLSVELNETNDNEWVSVELMGTTGITSAGSVNRSGIGAIVKFTPESGSTNIQPILGGSSYASQDSLIASFGMGSALNGNIEILWPGGVRNRLLNVRSGESILFPEIPCDVEDRLIDSAYESCVLEALDELVSAGILNEDLSQRFLASAIESP